MSAITPFALLANATSIPWPEVPVWPVADFVRATAAELNRGARLCAWFGVPEGANTCLMAMLAFDADNTLAVGRSQSFTGGYPALTTTHPQAHLFEREVWEQHGLTPAGHPWLKPVRRMNGNAPANGEFFRVDGPEIHEVAVGPVHAGIIEPGHFRFQCAGEEVLHLEIALGYQHRGVEEALTGGPHRATMSQMETVAATPPSPTPPLTRQSWNRSPAPKLPCAPNGCGPWRSNSNASPTTPATWARWLAMLPFCPPPRRAVKFAATF